MVGQNKGYGIYEMTSLIIRRDTANGELFLEQSCNIVVTWGRNFLPRRPSVLSRRSLFLLHLILIPLLSSLLMFEKVRQGEHLPC